LKSRKKSCFFALLGAFLLLKDKARALQAPSPPTPLPKGEGGAPGVELEVFKPVTEPEPEPGKPGPTGPGPEPKPEPAPVAGTRTLRISGNVPPEIWNRLGAKILPKLRSGTDIKIGIEFSVTVDGQMARSFEVDIKQILADMGLSDSVKIE